MIPVYVFLGFLEAGKTAFVQETLEDPEFNTGEKTLLVVCEEGVEEYEPDRFAGGNVTQLAVEDPDDLTPTAIRRLGAQVVTHGVPSQPGNMTLVAYLGDIPILGVPGAAISLPTTIFDVLLPQIFAGDRLTRRDLINLGDGGLCQMCKACHYPNCTFGRY